MRVPLQWSGGVNLNVDPKALRDNQLARGLNVWPTLEGLLDKREPVLPAGEIKGVNGEVILPIALFVPDPVIGAQFVLHWVTNLGAEALSVIDADQPLDSTLPSSIFINLNPHTLVGPASFTNYRGRCLAVTGDQDGFYQLTNTGIAPEWNKASFQWLADSVKGIPTAQSQSISVKPRVITSFRGRMVYGNFGPGMENWIVFGDAVSTTHTNVKEAPLWAIVGDDVLSFNGRHLELAAIQGEAILAMKEVTLSAVGSSVQTALKVDTDRSTLLCTGTPAQTTDSGFTTPDGYINDFQVHKVNMEVGCAGTMAQAMTPYGLCWASKSDVWLLQGNMPVRVGTNIRPVLESCPSSWRKYWSMTYANGVVYLALATQAGISERNLAIQHWRLDLRQGAPNNAVDARWWGPQDYEGLANWATNGDTDLQCHSSCILTRRDADEFDTVYGAVFVQGFSPASMFLISYNRGEGGMDVPFRAPTTGRAWSPQDNIDGMIAPLGDFILPSVSQRNGRLYVVTVAGIPGAAEPVWPTTPGTAVVSGAATYREVRTASLFTRLTSFYSGTISPSPTILMDVWFKDNDFGEAAREKIVRRADMEAFFALKTRVDMPVVINGGNYVHRMGPVTMGDYTTGVRAPGNHLGIGLLGGPAPIPSISLAHDYQARTMRPCNTDGRGSTINEPFSEGVVRGRQLMPKIREGDGFIIDESNNFIVWATFHPDFPIAQGTVWQGEITKGYYANVDLLNAAIAAAMNTGLGANQPTGFTVAANPWSHEAWGATFPYFNGLSMAFSVRTTGDWYACLLAGAGIDAGASPTVFSGITYYTNKSQRLLAMLGYDTGEAYSNYLMYFVDDIGIYVNVIGEQYIPVLTTPATIWGVEVMEYKRASPASITSIDLDIALKRGLPFSGRSR